MTERTQLSDKMTDLEAVNRRYSRRSYLNTPISASNTAILKASIDKYNLISGLSIQFIEDGRDAFHGFRRSYGLFHGVRSFFAMVGKTSDPDRKDKLGYYGELLVLEATKLGLGTCWVGGSYDKKHCPCRVAEGEELICTIPVGNVEDRQTLREKVIHRATHHGSKRAEDFYTAASTVPAWFIAGVEAVRKAPSAVNAQPVRLDYKSEEVTIYVEDPGMARLIDLGIAKAHFEIGAAGCPTDPVQGSFAHGNYSVFHILK
jgi:hypothetical protein